MDKKKLEVMSLISVLTGILNKPDSLYQNEEKERFIEVKKEEIS